MKITKTLLPKVAMAYKVNTTAHPDLSGFTEESVRSIIENIVPSRCVSVEVDRSIGHVRVVDPYFRVLEDFCIPDEMLEELPGVGPKPATTAFLAKVTDQIFEDARAFVRTHNFYSGLHSKDFLSNLISANVRPERLHKDRLDGIEFFLHPSPLMGVDVDVWNERLVLFSHDEYGRREFMDEFKLPKDFKRAVKEYKKNPSPKKLRELNDECVKIKRSVEDGIKKAVKEFSAYQNTPKNEPKYEEL